MTEQKVTGGRSRGRPPKAEEERNSVEIHTLWPPPLAAALTMEAARRGWDRNQLIRWIVREYFLKPVEWPEEQTEQNEKAS